MTDLYHAPLPLFTQPRPEQIAHSRRSDPLGSHIAAGRGNEAGTFKGHEGIIVEAVKAHPGCTPYELAPHCAGLREQQVYRRVGGLKAKGAISEGKHRVCKVHDSECQTLWPYGEVPEEWKLDNFCERREC